MPIDNFMQISEFIDEKPDSDTFWYTELLDRNITAGSNRNRLLKRFEHTNRNHFLQQADDIRELCEKTGCRAMTRLSPRSRKTVGELTLRTTLDCVLAGHHEGLRHVYGSALGTTRIRNRQLWLFDVDEPDVEDKMKLLETLRAKNVLCGIIPSKSGIHLICEPHIVDYAHWDIELQKDNPTNTYIPDDAT